MLGFILLLLWLAPWALIGYLFYLLDRATKIGEEAVVMLQEQVRVNTELLEIITEKKNEQS